MPPVRASLPHRCRLSVHDYPALFRDSAGAAPAAVPVRRRGYRAQLYRLAYIFSGQCHQVCLLPIPRPRSLATEDEASGTE